jgi:hypothetical protein
MAMPFAKHLVRDSSARNILRVPIMDESAEPSWMEWRLSLDLAYQLLKMEAEDTDVGMDRWTYS